MTTQIPERLKFRGENLVLLTFPLEQYFKLLANQSPFVARSSACWRGYVGAWELLEGRLYIASLSGSFESGRHASLEDLFPGFGERVFAHWYTGILSVPRGQPLPGVPNAMVVMHERTLNLELRRGVLQSEWEHINGTASQDARHSGYPLTALTTFGTNRPRGKN